MNFGYDQFGNMNTTVSNAGCGVSANPPTPGPTAVYTGNQLTKSAAASQTIGYDAAGNILSNPDMGATMTYDGEGRVVTWLGSGTNGATYDYDGEGRRVRKTLMGVSAGTTYLCTMRGGSWRRRLGRRGATDTGTTYLTDDHLGSTRLVTDGAGAFKQRWDYLPFGQLIAGSAAYGNRDQVRAYPAAGPASGVDLEFTGKERDAETGLDYFGARYLEFGAGAVDDAGRIHLRINIWTTRRVGISISTH